jgi:hypothetical protein
MINDKSSNLWILTEERLKISVLKDILKIYVRDNNIKDTDFSNLKINPIIKNGYFINQYEIENIKIENINKIYSTIVSGKTSFVDHLLFKQKNRPDDFSLKTKNFQYFIEDTKTDTKESRNTAFGQRATKTIIANHFNKSPFKLLITSSIFKYNEFPDSAKFDAKCLMTTGVEIFIEESKVEDKKFTNVDDLILEKNSMRQPPSSNIPFRIEKAGKNINISKKIIKAAGPALSDPSIGQILNVCFALRKLNFIGDITISKHGLNQANFTNMSDNKLLLGCKLLNIKLENIVLSTAIAFPETYWKYPNYSTQEKHATILLHHLIEYKSKELEVIFDHHAGCARNYIKDEDNNNYSVNKTPKGKTPDLIVRNKKDKILYMIEGKTHNNINKGIEEIKGFPEFFEKHLVKDCNYKGYKMESWITLTGISDKKTEFKNVMFTLKEDGLIDINQNLDHKFKKVLSNF